MDFRSDTVTKPSAAMRQAMLDATVGDDVYGEDPTVNALESNIAKALGYEAGLYGVSGTQTNLLGLMAHCQRGDEVIVGQQAHTYKWEGGGMAVLGSIQPQPILQQADGTIALSDIEAAIKPDDFHYAKTKLIALENTWGGRVLPLAYFPKMKALANARGLLTHLDGARLFNAAVADNSGLSHTQIMENARQICASFNSVSICLSKGLGAPVGALLLGDTAFIKRARRLRKMIGGGMRQAGIVAAAGQFALDNNLCRLADDHRRAKQLASALLQASAGRLEIEAPQTNIVWAKPAVTDAEALFTYLYAHRVKAGGKPSIQRWVLHLDISDDDVTAAAEAVAGFYRQH
jgi:threonine aldolase